MSIFAREITKTVEVPGDSPNTITVRKLSGTQIINAQDAVAKQGENPMRWRRVVIGLGLMAWTYDAPLTDEWLDEIDNEACDFIAAEIMKLTTPEGFTSTEQAQAAQKND